MNTVGILSNTDGILTNTVGILTLPRTFEKDRLVVRILLHVPALGVRASPPANQSQMWAGMAVNCRRCGRKCLQTVTDAGRNVYKPSQVRAGTPALHKINVVCGAKHPLIRLIPSVNSFLLLQVMKKILIFALE